MSVRDRLLDPSDISGLDAPKQTIDVPVITSQKTCGGRVWSTVGNGFRSFGGCIGKVCRVTGNILKEGVKKLTTTSPGALALIAASAAWIPFTADHMQLISCAVFGGFVDHFDQTRKKERCLRAADEELHCVTKVLDFVQDVKGSLGKFDNIFVRIPLLIHGTYPDEAYRLGATFTGMAITAKLHEVISVWGDDKELTFDEFKIYTALWYAVLVGGGLGTTFKLSSLIVDDEYRKICQELSFMFAMKPVGTEILRFTHYSILVLQCYPGCKARSLVNIAKIFRSIYTFPSIIVAAAFTLRELFEDSEIVVMSCMGMMGAALGFKKALFKSTMLPRWARAGHLPEMASSCEKTCYKVLKVCSVLIQLGLLAFAIQDILDPDTRNRLNIPYEGAVFILSAFFMYYLRVIARNSETPLGAAIIDFGDKYVLESIVISMYLIKYIESHQPVAYGLISSAACSVMIAVDDALNGRGKNPNLPGRLHQVDTPSGARILAIV